MTIKIIKVWIREGGAGTPRRLLTSMTTGCRFTTERWWNRLDNPTDDDLIKLAKSQRDGWRFNGPYPHAEFELEALDLEGEEVAI